MIKVKIMFTSNAVQEFYSKEFGNDCNGGRALYWFTDRDVGITIPLYAILAIEESGEEEDE